MTVKKSELSRLLLDIDMAKELFQSSKKKQHLVLKLVERLEQDFELVKELIKCLEN